MISNTDQPQATAALMPMQLPTNSPALPRTTMSVSTWSDYDHDEIPFNDTQTYVAFTGARAVNSSGEYYSESLTV